MLDCRIGIDIRDLHSSDDSVLKSRGRGADSREADAYELDKH
jgi:hypothetical protein